MGTIAITWFCILMIMNAKIKIIYIIILYELTLSKKNSKEDNPEIMKDHFMILIPSIF